jgi:hypothetical protein
MHTKFHDNGRPGGLPTSVTASFKKRNRPFISVAEFTHINKHEKNNINESWCKLYLTPWGWSLLEKLLVVKLLKNFQTLYGARRFIIWALHWSISWERSIQSIPPHTISLRSSLILSKHRRHDLPSGLFPSGFPTNILCALFFSPFMLHTLPSHPPWYLGRSTNYTIPHYAVSFNLTSPYPSSAKYSPQHPVLKNPQSMFFP